MFYGKEQVVRSGGGKQKMKNRRKTISVDQLQQYDTLISKIKDAKTVEYYKKLRDRGVNMSPPRCQGL